MNIIEKFSKLSARAKAWWILGLIVVFTITVGLLVTGSGYNNFAKNLSKKTNGIVALPLVKEIPFSLGLDLQGGTHLVYKADVSGIPAADQASALESVRDVIEHRVNVFGVSEPLVQVNHSAGGDYRIIAELAGIKDVNEAIKMIGETPLLEFRETVASAPIVLNASSTSNISLDAGNQQVSWKNTELSGKDLKRAVLEFDQKDGSPYVSLEFNDNGAKEFAAITERNIGKPVAILLDGQVISSPNVNEKISGGKAMISGSFTIDEAKNLVKRLNSGALPVPISLISQQTVESSLGAKSINNSLVAGLIGLLLVSIFMIAIYRFPGVLAVVSLLVYGLTVLAIFKALPLWLAFVLVAIMIGLLFYTFNEIKVFNGGVALLFLVIGVLLFVYASKSITLTLSGIAGFIMSIGMAVDANILIFERVKEELRAGKSLSLAVDEGFRRAWPSIRDGNTSTILTCFILMFFGTSAVQGFGTALFIGLAVSLFSAIVITRTLLTLVLGKWLEKHSWLIGSNLVKKN
ncbi:MAG: protein translocase subunit SecD [Candidatus Falkowbacteria bacterium]|nr:protein translocase subunit SecD [Candidatus Falkowbacteria bacterium]